MDNFLVNPKLIHGRQFGQSGVPTELGLALTLAVRSLWFGEKLVNKIESLVVSDHSVQGFIRKLVCG